MRVKVEKTKNKKKTLYIDGSMRDGYTVYEDQKTEIPIAGTFGKTSSNNFILKFFQEGNEPEDSEGEILIWSYWKLKDVLINKFKGHSIKFKRIYRWKENILIDF